MSRLMRISQIIPLVLFCVNYVRHVGKGSNGSSLARI
jgi:hypothetical protein